MDKDEAIINDEKHKSLDLHPKFNKESLLNLGSDSECPPSNLSNSISPFITNSIWRKPTNITDFATLGMEPESARKVYYGSDATGRPPGMLENILDDHDSMEWHDLSHDVHKVTQTERYTLDRDAIFRSSFLDNRVQLEAETFRFNSRDVRLLNHSFSLIKEASYV